MKYLDRISIYYLIITFLVSLFILGALSFGIPAVFSQALPPVLATVSFDALLRYFKLKKLVILPSAVITGLIIGLVAQFGEDPLTLFLIGAAAVLSKFIIKMDGRHIFNPAGTGLLFGSLFLSSHPSWWAGGGNFWIFFIWIPILMYKMRRWSPMAGFLAPAFLIGGPVILTSSSALFFTSVMLIEPKTSPFTAKLGLIYGFCVAASYLILGTFLQYDPLVSSLLIGNLIHSIIRLRPPLAWLRS